jgi:hypothetical protein
MHSFLKFVQFVLRFLGLNGLIAVVVGVVLWLALGYELAGLIVLMAGAAGIALALLGELHGLVRAVASHRGAMGANVALQITLAAALVIGVNVYSFFNFKRFDFTKNQSFTLPEPVRERLAKLRGDTDIIIYVPHVSFGQRSKLGQDELDHAASKIIVGKVKDLAEQFSELGPRFRVLHYDTQGKNSKEMRKRINQASGELSEEQLRINDNPTEDKPAVDSELLKTIENAPEDSIFFYTRDTKRLQRLAFHDIYQLDKQASVEANKNKGNLVLVDQGVHNFAEKIFKIEEKKPRIGIAVIHGVLGQDGSEELGMPALKKMLAARGFESRDIVLKKWPQRDAAALEHEENRYEILEAQKNHFERTLRLLDDKLKDYKEQQQYWMTKSAKEISKEWALVNTLFGLRPVPRSELEAARKRGRIILASDVTEEFREFYNAEWKDDIEGIESEIKSGRKKRDKAIEEQSKLRVENLKEQRRITDVRAKFSRLLADVDLLVVPRATIFNAVTRDRIPNRVYPLDNAHIEAIKEFMKAGKPVLFCLGPMNEPGDERGEKSGDSLEELLAPFNIQLPNQAILYSTEEDALAEGEDREQLPGGNVVEIPSARFDWKILPASTRHFSHIDTKAGPPLRSSLRLTARGLDLQSGSGLKIRAPRPVYVVQTTFPPETIAGAIGALSLPGLAGPSQALAGLNLKATKKFNEKNVFLMTDPESWNEDRPLGGEKWIPHFERPKADDPNKGSILETRRGPFPIGVALEADVPEEWYENDPVKKPAKVRLVVIGHGGLFIGEKDKLSPIREKLFLDVSNWLLGRDNLLAQEGAPWQYPRVELRPEAKNLWTWGTRLGLPLLFVCLGLNVWLVRRMR